MDHYCYEFLISHDIIAFWRRHVKLFTGFNPEKQVDIVIFFLIWKNRLIATSQACCLVVVKISSKVTLVLRS